MGTVNGLESGDFGPDINTQRLILPAGRQWEKDTGGVNSQRRRAVGESEGLFCPETKQTGTGGEGTEGAEDLPPDCRNTSGEEQLDITAFFDTKE